MVTSQCVSFAIGELPTSGPPFEQPEDEFTKESLEEEEEDCSFEILLTLKKEHRVRNKILGELNILSLSISES